MKKIFTIICIALAVITNAQNTFTAKVLNSENAEALIGASLILKGTTNGVSTDINGLAILKNISHDMNSGLYSTFKNTASLFVMVHRSP